MQAYRAPDAPRTRRGFRVKVLWIMDPHQRNPIRIEGTNIRTGGSVWFKAEDSGPPGSSARLDPDEQGVIIQSDGWREFPSYLYFPGAGCYELVARWSKGSWRLVFGLGG
jgi:hypothetical protein